MVSSKTSTKHRERHQWKADAVHKFGGSSLKSKERFEMIQSLLTQDAQVIVLSAIANTTRVLRQGLWEARDGKDYRKYLDLLKDRHLDMASSLLKDASEFNTDFITDLDQLAAIYHAVSILGHFSDLTEDFVLSYGELWSSKLATLYFGPDYLFIDAFDILVVNKHHGHVEVNWALTQEKATRFIQSQTFKHLVITGYTACNQDGNRITLGFNGSDYSAAIFSRLFQASELIIWTDVEGIYSTDPRSVESAKVIPKISYQEAKELAYFGASVVHPQTIMPAMSANIPIQIKNSYKPELPGSVICVDGDSTYQIKGVTLSEKMCLITVNGLGLSTVAKLSNKLFEALHLANIRVYAYTQASSEHSLCVVISSFDKEKAEKVARRCFDYELITKKIDGVVTLDGIRILALVGDSIQTTPSIFESLLASLQHASIDLRLIAHGYGAKNIAVCIDEDKSKEALSVVHQAVFKSE